MKYRRYIDPNTRDYVLEGGGYKPDIGNTSKVVSRITTKRGSVIPLPWFGSLLHTIRGPVPGYQQLARRYVEDALADMVRSREVNNLRVEVGRESGALTINVEYTDRRGRRQKVRVKHRLTGA